MDTERLTPDEYLQKLEMERQKSAQQEEPRQEPQETTESAEKKKKKKGKKKRRKKHYLLRLVIFIAVIVGLYFLLKSPIFYVTKIEVHGNQYYTPSQVIELSELETGKNLFFEIKTKPARDKLLETPYIKVAHIDRKPIGTIVITIEERPEFAAFPFGDEYAIIDNEGLVLRVSDKQPELPVLEGMNIEELTEGSPLKIEQTYLLTDTLELLDKMEEADLYFYKIYFSSVVVKAYINENYYCEGQPSEISANIEALKALMQEQYNAGVNKGIIRVGSNGYMAFDPKID